MAYALLIIAQGVQHTQEAPDSGPGALLIIGAVVFVALLFAGLFFVFTRRSRRSRGGVQEPQGSRRSTGPPPLEGIERER
jgi:hypothetical protein